MYKIILDSPVLISFRFVYKSNYFYDKMQSYRKGSTFSRKLYIYIPHNRIHLNKHPGYLMWPHSSTPRLKNRVMHVLQIYIYTAKFC